MKNFIQNEASEDIRNREVVERLAMPERKSSGVFYYRKRVKPFTRALRFNENRRLELRHTKRQGDNLKHSWDRLPVPKAGEP